jgi:hypothetical protein
MPPAYGGLGLISSRRSIRISAMPAKKRKSTAAVEPLAAESILTPKEYAAAAKISVSWLAKARKRGIGPQYMQFGGSVRYFPPKVSP